MMFSLLKSVSVVSLMTLASRVTGLVRDVLMASMFGAGPLTDAFNVAFRIPNLLRRLFAEGAFAQAFVPTLSATLKQEGPARTKQLITHVACVLTWALALTCVVGIVAAPALVWMLASGLDDVGSVVHTTHMALEAAVEVPAHAAVAQPMPKTPNEVSGVLAQLGVTSTVTHPSAQQAAITMTRWMFPYIACMSLVALASGVLNTYKRFAVPAATPVLLNVAMIAAATLLAPRFALWGIEPIYAMAAGVMLGGILQLGVQIPALHRLGMLPRVALSWQGFRQALGDVLVRRILSLMAPALLGVGVAQLSLMINTQIASHLGAGSVTWLFYADRLMEFPTALLGVALGVVLTPSLSEARAEGNAQRYSDLLDWGLRLVLIVAVPCAVALLAFAQPLVATLFHRGALTAADVQQIARALQGYGVGLIGLVAVKVLASGYFARQDTRTPVRIAVVVLLFTQACNVALVPKLGHAALGWSIGLGALLNATWLLVGLMQRGSYVPRAGWAMLMAQVMAASLLLASFLLWASDHGRWLDMGELERALTLAAAIVTAMALYAAALLAAGVRPKHLKR